MLQNGTATWGNNPSVGWRWYLVQRRFITYSLPPICSSFHQCFCGERCYFCTFVGGLVACRAITVAVAESCDPTLWQEIITNIIHSAVVIVTWISWGHVSKEERCEGEAKRKYKNADASSAFAASGTLLVIILKKGFPYRAKLAGPWIRS